MAWYNFTKKEVAVEKYNPAQPYFNEKVAQSREPTYSYEKFYEKLEVVNRGVNMIVDDASDMPSAVGEQLTPQKGIAVGLKKEKVDRLINRQPNPYQDINTFRRNLITDFILDGNIFIYFDGNYMYHLPASKMSIEASDKEYIKSFTFNGTVHYSPDEIIHIKENSFYSIYRGVPRLKPALRTMQILHEMRTFQDNFFKNGAVPGLVIKSPNTLSPKLKDRLLASWTAVYNPTTGGKRPLILDGGLEIDSLADVNFRDLDFQASIETNEKIILKALGVPPIMLDSGNNANLRPNMRMYYLETVLPIVRKINFGMERYFGYKIVEDITNIPALQPELNDQANFYSSLVNGGVLSPNEARVKLGFEPMGEEHDELRIPANIAGSAGDPSEGGRPSEETE